MREITLAIVKTDIQVTYKSISGDTARFRNHNETPFVVGLGSKEPVDTFNDLSLSISYNLESKHMLNAFYFSNEHLFKA